MNISVIYGVMAVLSGFLLAGYFLLIKKKDYRFTFLFLSILIVNIGYFWISVSSTLEMALMANRCSYLGSALLPLFMLFIIIEACHVPCDKRVMAFFLYVSVCAFLLAASGGYMDFYYSAVSIIQTNGVTRLIRDHGPLHILYSLYLFIYFGIMIGVIVFAVKKKRVNSPKHGAILLSVVLGNLMVWLVEQMIDVDFEFLSVSYIATGLCFLLVHSLIMEYETIVSTDAGGKINAMQVTEHEMPADVQELFDTFAQKVNTLTPTERLVLQHFIDGYSLEEIAVKNFISVNTAKKHNTNLNRKLGVSSREELFLYIDLFRRCGRLDEITYQK